MTSNGHLLRILTAASALATLAIGVGAQASSTHDAGKKVKPVCNLIKATASPAAPASLQVVGGDVATNASTITVAVRVTKLTPQPDSSAPLGRQWSFTFISGQQVTLDVTDGPFGVTSSLPGKVTLDSAHNEIRLSTPIKNVVAAYPNAQLTPRRSLLTGITATADEVVQDPANSVLHQEQLGGYGGYNQAVSPRNYLAGTPSCLKVGS